MCHMDDVLVVGRDQEQHDTRLTKVLERIESAELTLNAAKCEFSRVHEFHKLIWLSALDE